MLRVLVIFSNPPGHRHLRLDREDKIIAQLARTHGDSVAVERLHAGEIDDIHALISNGHYDIIQFSGHGDSVGIYLDKSDVSQLVSAERFRSLMECTLRHPNLVILLACYSSDHIKTLAGVAPFVVTTGCEVLDEACTLFIRDFYDSLFRGQSVQASFDHAIHLLDAKGFPSANFKLDRRCLIQKGDSRLLESTPDSTRDSIWVNLDRVADRLGSFGMPEEELCYLLAKKLSIHSWIFDTPRERATIPIGRSLFGEFSWRRAKDVVHCTRLMKLRTDTPMWHWDLWSRLLTSYNDLASHEYRDPDLPVGVKRADRSRQTIISDAVRLFTHHGQKYLVPVQPVIVGHDKLKDLLPHIGLALAEIERAQDHLQQEKLDAVIIALELALTNYHEMADGVQPPEEETVGTPERRKKNPRVRPSDRPGR
jgi:hypothetical protein